MAYTGLAWPLIDGVGSIYGMYVVTGLQETHQEFDRYGKSKKIEFTLTLQRVDEDIRERLQSSSVSDLMATLKDDANSGLNSIKKRLIVLHRELLHHSVRRHLVPA